MRMKLDAFGCKMEIEKKGGPGCNHTALKWYSPGF